VNLKAKQSLATILEKEFGYSPQSATLIASGKRKCSKIVESGIHFYHRLQNMLKRAEECTNKDFYQKIVKMIEQLGEIDNPKKIIERAKKEKYIKQYINENAIKTKLGLPPTTFFYHGGKRSEKRAASSVRFVIGCMAIEDALLEYCSKANCFKTSTKI